jgi:ABC-type Co2+ transport system permease subunit
MGHASRYNGLLHLKVSHVRIFQSVLKTDGGMTTSGAHNIIAKVALRGS